jgi:hypothetical protein
MPGARGSVARYCAPMPGPKTRPGPRDRLASPWPWLRPIVTSTWTLGFLVAIATWNVTFGVPTPGLDLSWDAGMHMAAHLGLDFGRQIIWTYGPLAFLQLPATYYSGMAALGFCWQAFLLVAYCVSLIWALRRAFNAPVAIAVTFVTVLALPNTFIVLVPPAVWCLAALAEHPPPFAPRLVSVGGAAFGAVECLVRLSWGPTILLMSAATLLALPDRRRELPIFAGTAATVFAILWFAAGQGIGNFPDFVSSAAQVVGGYSEAMGLDHAPRRYIPIAIATAVLLVGSSVLACRLGRSRVAAGVVMALPAFAIYKEAVVRYEETHVAVFFATAAPLLMAVPRRGRFRPISIPALLAVGAVALHTVPSNVYRNFNPITHVKSFATEVRTLASADRRNDIIDRARFSMAVQYRLDPKTLALLKDHGVHVDPWEAGVVWALGLDWKPLPVFQDYQAYTEELDAENAGFLRSPTGPERILRENAPAVQPEFSTAAIDGRYPTWDPPEAAIAMLCNFSPLHTTSRWQVLGRAADRCGQPRLMETVRSEYGRSVAVPGAAADEMVFAKIHGAGVSGLERLRTFLFRATFRRVRVNDRTLWRLVPGTAADGLIMSIPETADFPGRGFTLSPGVHTFSVLGKPGSLTIDFYAMPIEPLSSQHASSRRSRQATRPRAAGAGPPT